MIPFDAAHRAVHYPKDRKFRIWIRPSVLVLLVVLCLIPLVVAWIQGAVYGIPYLAPTSASMQGAVSGPHGFPAWIRWSHFFNMFFLFMLVRSGLSILVDHPRLYFNDDCTPGTEWIRFTPLRVPKDRVWTAKDDARYISPVVALPGYRHTIGVARSWHFINVYGFMLTGIFFVCGLLTSDQWLRLVPTSMGCSCRRGTRSCTTRISNYRLNRTAFTGTMHCSSWHIALRFSSWRHSRS